MFFADQNFGLLTRFSIIQIVSHIINNKDRHAVFVYTGD
jgi:hypothetical protein